LRNVLGRPDYPTQVIGTRHGEKLFEVLLSREEMVAAEDLGNYFRVAPDLRDLNYEKFVEKGRYEVSAAEDYNSHNTQRLSVSEMETLLLRLPFIEAARLGQDVIPAE